MNTKTNQMQIKLKTRKEIVDTYLDQLNSGTKLTKSQKRLINTLTSK